ncbi:uncharacterized protein LOC115215452 [Argonauta hians]
MDDYSDKIIVKEKKQRKQFWKMILTFSGIIMLHLSLGAAFIIGNIIPYVVSYMRMVGKEPNLTYANGIWVSSIGGAGFGCSMLSTTYLEKALGFRKTILFGSLIQSGSFLLTYFVIKGQFYQLVIVQGFLCNAGVAIPYIVTLACAMKWLPHRRATAAGIVLCAHGMSAFVFNFVSSNFINPDNCKEDYFVGGEYYFSQKDILDRIPKCFLMLGGVFMSSQIISVCLISNPDKNLAVKQVSPEDVHTQVGGKENITIECVADETEEGKNIPDEKRAEGVNPSESSVIPPEGRAMHFTPWEMINTRQFYILWILMLFQSIIFMTISGAYKVYGLTFILDDHFLTTLGSLCAVGNASARLIWGVICDRLLFRDSNILLCISMAVLYLLLNISPMIGRYFYMFVALLTYMCGCGVYVCMPYIINKSFGSQYYATNSGIIYTALIVGGLVDSFMVSGMADSIGWNWTFFLQEVMSLICIFFIIIYTLPKSPARRASTIIAAKNEIKT